MMVLGWRRGGQPWPDEPGGGCNLSKLYASRAPLVYSSSNCFGGAKGRRESVGRGRGREGREEERGRGGREGGSELVGRRGERKGKG
jgi:hypothetical protein